MCFKRLWFREEGPGRAAASQLWRSQREGEVGRNEMMRDPEAPPLGDGSLN